MSTGLALAAASSWLRAARSSSSVWPPRSSSTKLKPLATPSPWIDGGLSVKTIASLICISAPSDLLTSVRALFCSPGRSSHGLRLTNAIAFACPCPKKLKPRTRITLRTCGCALKNALTCSIARFVRSVVAPGGACMAVNTLP